MRIVVIVDAQNDFIDGVLGTPEAQAAVPNIVEKLKEYEGTNTLVLFTKDTHFPDYNETQEGKKLPIQHCQYMTPGWSINKTISSYVKEANFATYSTEEIVNGRILKPTFGSITLANAIADISANHVVDEVVFMGFCTDICIISNLLLTKAVSPNIPLIVDAKCCAGVTPEKHEAALEVMRSCQIKVI